MAAPSSDPQRPPSPSSPGRPVLAVGLVCLDIISLCGCYPREDEDIRAAGQEWKAGGNAANSSKVLSLLGRACEFFGTLGVGMETDFAVSQLDKYGVCHDNCVVHSDCSLPTSSVILNTSNGSRTIVHYRNLPELTYEHFAALDLNKYSWIHFEGRNPPEYTKMINHIAAYNEKRPKCPSKEEEEEEVRGEKARERLLVSVEVEKKHPELSQLLPLADVLMVSKDYAQFQGYHTMEEAVVGLRGKAKQGAVVVCAWGEKGAAACDAQGRVHTSPAYPPSQVVDTLGAGDTFNAGLIHRLSSGDSVEQALAFACRLAGTKCGMLGFDGLRQL